MHKTERETCQGNKTAFYFFGGESKQGLDNKVIKLRLIIKVNKWI